MTTEELLERHAAALRPQFIVDVNRYLKQQWRRDWKVFSDMLVTVKDVPGLIIGYAFFTGSGRRSARKEPFVIVHRSVPQTVTNWWEFDQHHRREDVTAAFAAFPALAADVERQILAAAL